MEDEQIIGVFYGGSIGNQHTDLYSDIDLRKAGLSGRNFNENIFSHHRKC